MKNANIESRTAQTPVTIIGCVALAAALLMQPASAQTYFNTVKAKLAAGEQVVGGTVESPDVNIYCAMASSGFDFHALRQIHNPTTG